MALAILQQKINSLRFRFLEVQIRIQDSLPISGVANTDLIFLDNINDEGKWNKGFK